jgi:hypothetical protein
MYELPCMDTEYTLAKCSTVPHTNHTLQLLLDAGSEQFTDNRTVNRVIQHPQGANKTGTALRCTVVSI